MAGTRLGLAAACLGILIGSCAQPSGSPSADLTGVPWELASGNVDGDPLPMVGGFPITLTIDEGTAGGTAACNGYFAVSSMSGSEISFAELGATAMACSPEEVMESEQRYLDALPRVASWSATEDQLTFTGDGVELTFIALPSVPTAELTGTVWVLEGLIEGDSVASAAGERATLELYTDGSMLGSTGCRGLHGRYEVVGAEVLMTEMAAEGECSPELQDQDGLVVTVLGDGFRPAVSGQDLTLTSMGGLGLAYRAEG